LKKECCGINSIWKCFDVEFGSRLEKEEKEKCKGRDERKLGVEEVEKQEQEQEVLNIKNKNEKKKEEQEEQEEQEQKKNKRRKTYNVYRRFLPGFHSRKEVVQQI
jgi:membrane-bound lytic murein transglycosylase